MNEMRIVGKEVAKRVALQAIIKDGVAAISDQSVGICLQVV